MRERIINDIKEAMRSQDKEKLSVLRMVKGAIQLEEISKKKELDDSDVIGVIAKQIKTRKESIVEFEKGNRNDLIEKTQGEIEILEAYMPAQLTEEEINNVIISAINQVNAKSIKDMGNVMSVVSLKLRGVADMSLVSKLVKESLTNIDK